MGHWICPECRKKSTPLNKKEEKDCFKCKNFFDDKEI